MRVFKEILVKIEKFYAFRFDFGKNIPDFSRISVGKFPKFFTSIWDLFRLLGQSLPLFLIIAILGVSF